MDPQRSPTSPRSRLGTLSVREVCRFELLRNVKVLAGGSGMDRRVQRLNVMTVPDIARWTKPDELLLATGFPLSRKTEELVTLVRDLDERGIAALAVKLGDYGAVLEPAVLQTADEVGLPVLAVPEEVPFDDILSEVLAAITNRQAGALSRAQRVHEALLRISLGGGGLDEIVRELGSVIEGLGVVCVNTSGEVLAEQLTDEQWQLLRNAGVVDETGTLSRLSVVVGNPERYGSTMLGAPVSAGELRHGYLLAVSVTGELDQEVEMMVQQAAMVAALNISRDVAVSAVARRFEASAIHSLLAGSGPEIEEVAQRSGDFEWDLDRPLVVLAARREEQLAEPEQTMSRLHDLGPWLSAVRSVDRQAAAGQLGRNLVAICGGTQDTEALATAIAEAVAGATRTRLRIGVSDVAEDVASLPSAYEHARMALEFAQQYAGSGSVRTYQSLGLFRLLNAVPDRRELQTFVDEAIGPLLALPPNERDDMLRTLDVLFMTRMNVAETSRVLHYHYNTLRYRIRKLEQLLGRFTEDSQLELRVTVALHIVKMWKMMD